MGKGVLNYTILVSYEYFENNRSDIRKWFLDQYIFHLWLTISRSDFSNYKIYFDKSEDLLAFRLRFRI